MADEVGVLGIPLGRMRVTLEGPSHGDFGEKWQTVL